MKISGRATVNSSGLRAQPSIFYYTVLPASGFALARLRITACRHPASAAFSSAEFDLILPPGYAASEGTRANP
jgi:hypothetical protein